MLAKYFSVIRNYVLLVSLQRKYTFYHQNTLLDAFRTNSRNMIGRNASMVIPLLANQDLTPMLFSMLFERFRNSIGRNPSMMIPLLANQNLTPMLRRPQYGFCQNEC